jgi:phosphoribosyl-AMP cyclohydrolase
MVRGFFIAPMNLDYSKLNGVLPAVIQDATTGRVLMLGFMNEEAFQRTVETGHVTFFSRSRNRLWTKGETSGHKLVVREIATDCDQDAVLVRVDAIGPGVCHNGYQSCFYRRRVQDDWVESESRTFDPEVVYGDSK